MIGRRVQKLGGRIRMSQWPKITAQLLIRWDIKGAKAMGTIKLTISQLRNRHHRRRRRPRRRPAAEIIRGHDPHSHLRRSAW